MTKNAVTIYHPSMAFNRVSITDAAKELSILL